MELNLYAKFIELKKLVILWISIQIVDTVFMGIYYLSQENS